MQVVLSRVSANRTPRNAPLPCFAVEYDRTAAECKVCPHAKGCTEHMPRKFGRTPLSQVKFSFAPELFTSSRKDPGSENIQETFAQCVRTILGAHAHVGWVGKDKATPGIIEDICDELGCTIKQYMLTNLVGHRETAPDRDFYPRQLTGDGAVNRFQTYRQECAKKYGTFDLAHLEKLHGNTVDDKMLASELVAGRWIVGYKMRTSGFPFDTFLNYHERQLDPVWLAIEPNYKDVLLGDDDGVSAMVKTHRHKVAKTLGALKRKKALARDAFKSREQAAPVAVSKVLREHGLDADKVYYHKDTVDDMIVLWSQIGLVLQHIQCIKYLGGDHDALKKISYGQIRTDD